MLGNLADVLNRVVEFLTPQIFPIAVIIYLMAFYIYYIKIVRPETGTTEWIKMKKEADGRRLTILNKRYPLEKADILPIIAITAIFMCFAVFNLGSSKEVDVMAEIDLWKTNAETEGRGSLSPGSNHLNNMYFDEVYNVRTAMEHMRGIYPYEGTHPPLGKNLIAASILIFGQSPFGWRMLGAICGVLMVLVMYLFIKNMFGKTPVAVCGSLLLGFEFMRLVQSRIGTIDLYGVFFILTAYYFMYRHITTDPDAKFIKSLPPLAFAGLFFGMSFTVKWIGFYAGAGMLILYIIRLVQLYMHYNSSDKKGFAGYFVKTVLFTSVFFIIVPAVVYYLNYIPYGIAWGLSLRDGMLWSREYFDVVWRNQIYMFNYHAYLGESHSYGSVWWQWILNIRPTFYANYYSGEMRAAFGAFGNPVVYWGGLVAMIIMAVRIFTHRDGKALIILIGYLVSLLPWLAVTRVLFAYHYFVSSLFLVLAIVHIFDTIFERGKKRHKSFVYGYTAVTGTVFAMFYPALAGVFMPQGYYSIFVKWLPSWPF